MTRGRASALTFEQARPYRLGLPGRTSSIKAHAASPDSILSDRYEILGEIASGGMASVLYGRLKGPAGFARAVAIKRMHPHIAREPDFVSMFIDEARICARLSHVNIVPILDVIEVPSELCLVMEYVHGAALDVLVDLTRERNEPMPVRVAVALLAGVLHGLHAAHETRGDHGEPLSVVHRDVSPQNVLVGEDGVARVLDFGIAKATGKLRSTPSGEIKGKLGYMAPEQFRGGGVDRRVDVYGAATVLWEALVGRPLFDGENESAVVYRVLNDEHIPPSHEREDVPPALDAIVLRGLQRDPEQRFATAREMALALERTIGGASQSDVSEWVRGLLGGLLDARAAELRRLSQRGNSLRDSDSQRALAARSEPTRKVPPSSPPTPLPTPDAYPSGRRRLALLLLTSCVTATLVLYLTTRPRGAPHEPIAAPAAAGPIGPDNSGANTQEQTNPSRANPLAERPRDRTTTPTAEDALEDLRSAAQRTAADAARPFPAKDVATPGVERIGALAPPPRAKRSADDNASSRAGTSRSGERPASPALRAAPKKASDAAHCSPPYWWSADGVKHYKRECL